MHPIFYIQKLLTMYHLYINKNTKNIFFVLVTTFKGQTYNLKKEKKTLV